MIPTYIKANETSKVNDEIIQFEELKSTFKLNELIIFTEEDIDVTRFHLSKIANIYKNGNINDLNLFLNDNSLSLGVFSNSSSLSSSKAKTTSFEKYYANSAVGNSNVVASWWMRLKGTFYYDINTRKITTYSNPVISIKSYTIKELKYTGLENFKPILTDVTTFANKINDYSCSFTGRFRFKSSVSDGFLFKELDFGYHQITYIGK